MAFSRFQMTNCFFRRKKFCWKVGLMRFALYWIDELAVLLLMDAFEYIESEAFNQKMQYSKTIELKL